MHVRSRQIAAITAAVGWLTVAGFCIAGPFSGFGLTPNMTRFFTVILTASAVLTVWAVVGYAITPLVASHGLGVRAAFRAGRDTPPPHPVSAVPSVRIRRQHQPGRHRDANAEGSVLRLVSRRL